MLRLRLLVALLSLALALCVLGLWSARSQTRALRRVTNTAEDGKNINPSLSGDGRRIAFESTEDLASAGGGDQFRAFRADSTTDPAAFVQMGAARAPAPGISQDGSIIAFAAKENPLGTNLDGNSEIFLFDGSTLRQITKTTPNDTSTRVRDGNFQPSLSDDGRFIAFSSNRNLANQNADGNLEIFIFDTTANAFTQLTNTAVPVGASDAKISGDATRVAYIRGGNTAPAVQRDLVLQDRLDGTIRLLSSNVTNLALAYGRSISDDGLRVVYSANTASNSSQVFLFDGRTTNATRQITTLGERETEVPLHPTISGDGTRIAFATRRTVTIIGGNSDNSIELYTHDIPTGQFARVTNATTTADGFNGSNRVTEVVSSLNDDGSVVAFNFPRALTDDVDSDFDNNSEIYVTGTKPRPTVGSLTILNEASFGHEPSTTKAVAPDSRAVALGGALSFTTRQADRDSNGNFPTTFEGTTVTVNGRAAQIFFVSPTEVRFYVPAETELGIAEAVVTNSEGFQSRGTVTVLRAAPGIFTKSGDGLGEAVVLDANMQGSGTFDPSDGQLRLIIFTTGVLHASQVTATAGGRGLTVESVMRTPGMPGMDEVRGLVPADLRGAGTVNLVVRADNRDSNPATIIFAGNACRDIVINEVLADPPDGSAGDANRDGVRDGTDDEFVELVNTTQGNIDISGYQLLTRSNSATPDTVRLTFPAGTLFPARSAILAFGGGNPDVNNPAFGGAQIFKTSSSAGLSLTNSGGVVTLREPSQAIANIFSYGGSTGLEGDSNQSLTRAPDAGVNNECGSFTTHTTAPGSNGQPFSPGTQINGAPFARGLGQLTSVTISPPSANVLVGQTTQFTARARDQFNRPMTNVTITFASDNTTVATVDGLTTGPATGIATATVTGRNEGTARITAQATGGTTTVTSSQAILTVNAPPPVVTRVEVSPSNGNINRGQTQQFRATAFDPNNQPIAGATFTWSSTDTNVASINSSGLATGTGLGTVMITAATSDATGAMVSGTANLTVQVPLVINEILADPPDGIAGDSNRDGVRDADNDEFVELVNNFNAPVDISGVILTDSTSNRFTFPANTTLAAGRAVVVFGGGSPSTNDPTFGGAFIFTTSSLSLGNTGDNVTIKLPVGGTSVVIATQTYGAEGNDNQSLTRSPDLSGAFAKHSTATNSDGRLFSPGTRVDGTPFGSPAITRIEVIPPSIAINIGQTQAFSARAFSNSGGPEIQVQNVSFIWDSSDATTATVSPLTGPSTTATALAAGTTTIRARAGGQQGTASLTINPPPPTLTINDVSINEGNTGTTIFALTVSLSSAAPAGAVTFDIATADGTAQHGNPSGEDNDYVARSLTTQTIPAGSQTYTFDVTINGDPIIEPNETFVVNVTNVSGATLGDGQGIGTIQNDDSATLSINDVKQAEGNSGTTTFTFTVGLSLPAPPGGVTFDIATADGTGQDDSPASDDNDYVARSLTGQTIPAGQQTYTIDVTVNGDTLVESNETFLVNVTNVSGAAVSDGPGQGTIQNDDTPLVVISQLYGGGSNSGATLTHDFIEIFNRGTTTVDLTGWSVQYLGATGTGTWAVTTLSGTLQPGQYYLIQEASNAAVGSPLPTPDATGTIVMAATAGKVALVNNTTALNGCPSSVNIIDLVGYGTTANCFEGTGPAPAPSATTGDLRANNGCTDTNNNAADFSTSAPNPRNTSSPLFNCSAPNLTNTDVTVAEGNAGTVVATFTVSLSAPAPSGGVTFNIATQDATATVANSDYVARSLTGQTIAAGSQTYTFDVTVNGDTNIEPDETFFVNVTNVAGANVSDGQGAGTIQNDDSATLSINDVSSAEGDSGTIIFTFAVSLSLPAPAGGVTFDIATADATAQDDNPAGEDNDYVARALTLQTIPVGQQSYTFDVTVNGDTLVEPNETFFVNVTNVSGASVSDAQGQGTIQNDDTANLVISQVYGGGNNAGAKFRNDFIEIFNRGTTTVSFSATPYSVQYAGATAAFGGSSAKTDITSGTIDPGQYFLVQEAGGTTNGVVLPTPDATGNIILAATAGKVALVVGTAPVGAVSCPGDDGTLPLNPSSGTIVDFVGYGSTANCFEGAGPAPAPGNTTVDFRKAGGCTDTNDNAADFLVSAPFPRNTSSATNNCIAGPAPTLTINDVTVVEGNAGTVTATFTVSLSALAPSTDITFDIATQNNTATTANNDYESNSLTNRVIPAGQQTFTFNVTVNGDTVIETDETFFVNVANVSGATLSDGQGLGTIQNDDIPALSINDVSMNEGNAATTTVTFTVSLSTPAPTGGVTFDIATADGTAQDDDPATEDNDYVARSIAGQTIPVGQQTFTFDVTVNGDTTIEPDETFLVNVTNVSGATVTDGQAVGTIQNDDSPTLAINDVSINEGNSGATTFTFTVTSSLPAPAGGITFDIATADGTAQDDNPATEDNDYVGRSLATQTITAGNQTYIFDVTVNGDTVVEPNETFFVNLTNVSGATVSDGQGQGTIQNDDAAATPQLVISQIYPGGGLTGASFTNDFIEIFNRGTTTVNFAATPYSVQFLSTGASTWVKTEITAGTIAPGQYFLIQEASGGSVGASLPTPDASGTINLTSTTPGKVALVLGTTLFTGACPGDDGSSPFNPVNATIVDFVGYGGNAATTNHCYEGAGPALFSTSTNQNARSTIRTSSCTDTNNNAAVFTNPTNPTGATPPVPRNSATPLAPCP